MLKTIWLQWKGLIPITLEKGLAVFLSKKVSWVVLYLSGLNCFRICLIIFFWFVHVGDMVKVDNGDIVDVWSLQWNNVDHAYNWCNRFATNQGFNIHIQNGVKHKKHEYWASRFFVCSKEGMEKEKDPFVLVQQERRNNVGALQVLLFSDSLMGSIGSSTGLRNTTTSW